MRFATPTSPMLSPRRAPSSSAPRPSAALAAPSASAGGPRAFDRDGFARTFLSVVQRLDALQPPSSSRREEASADGETEAARGNGAGAQRLLALLDSPTLVCDVFRRNESFRPSERLSGPKSSAKATARDAASPRAVEVALASSPTAKRALQRTDSAHNTGGGPKKQSPTVIDAPVYVAVGGKARVLPSTQLARIKAALRARSNALANIQPTAAASSELRKALQAAPGSTWEALRSSAAIANGQGANGSSTANTTTNSQSSSKQALIAELVGRTNFSTLHIFQMSRKFKAIAGAAKSVITFDEFRQIMSEDMGELLGGLDRRQTDETRDGSSTAELRTIGATIAASDTFLRRLFLAFDADGDGKIDIREFVVGLNSFVRGSPEEKVAALFEVYRSDSVSPGKGPPRVAISDLLGLFQGDRQLYQELMRCVDDYFVRVELRDETAISEDEFVAVSLEEPHLLDNISRPLPSRRYASEDGVRELVRLFIEQTRLNWRQLLHLHRALLAWSQHKRRESNALAAPASVSAPPPQDASAVSALQHETPAIVLPASELQAILRGDNLDVSALHRPPPDELLVQRLLLAYMAPPKDGSVADRDAAETHKRADADCEHAFVAFVAGSELSQDVAVAMLSTFMAEPDAEAKARYFFELFDANGDGFLSRSELSTAVCAGFAHFGRSVMEVVRVLEDEDADQDGELTEAEYLRAAHKSPTILASLYTCL